MPIGYVAVCVLVAGPHPALFGRHPTAETEYSVAGSKSAIQQLNGVFSTSTKHVCSEDPLVAVTLYLTTAGLPGLGLTVDINPNSR